MNVVVVDLDIGNLSNVQKAVQGTIATRARQIRTADKIVLPGVGHFGAIARRLAPLRDTLVDAIQSGTPILGICLGMHLLFDGSEESGDVTGLGVFAGRVRRLCGVPCPHIGWNRWELTRPSALMKGIQDGAYFYFVHSYYVEPNDRSVVTGQTTHGCHEENQRFPCVVHRDAIFGVQFHPEKSGDVGRRLLANFRDL